MKKSLTLFLLFVSGWCVGQDQRIWATYYGGENTEGTTFSRGLSVTTDASGNVYMAGVTQSDTGIASNGFQNTYGGNSDAFLVKYDSIGNRLWATYYGGTEEDLGHSVATDAEGNVYLTGETRSASGVAFNGFDNAIANTNYDAFLVKFDSAGNRLWATYYGGTGSDHSYGVATDTIGNVYLAGSTNSTTGIAYQGFDNAIGVGGGADAFIVKFDSTGNRIWATYYGGSVFTDRAYALATDLNGNVFMAGETMSSQDIASGGFQNTCVGCHDAFLVKFNSSGNRLWATYYGGGNSEYGYGVATDKFGNVYLAGEADSQNNIGSDGFQNARPGYADAFLAKFDSIGNRLWGTYYGGSDYDIGFGVATDTVGNAYLSGITRSETAIASDGFQDTLTLGYHNDFVVKFDTSGNRMCATYYGSNNTGNGNNYRNNVAADRFGNVYLAGVTDRSTDIAYNGSQNTLGGDKDCYLVKFNACENKLAARIASITSNTCSNECTASAKLRPSNGTLPYTYLWSDAQTTQTANGLCATTYTVTVTDASNNTASAFATIGFTNLVIDTAVIEFGTALQATAQNLTYQWIDCVNNNAPIDGATQQLFTPQSSNGVYAVILSDSNCSDTSGCHQILSVNISEDDVINKISIYPNPATTTLTLTTEQTLKNAELKIINAIGQEVYHSIFDIQRSTFDISSFHPGLYYLTLQSNEGVATKKFEVIR